MTQLIFKLNICTCAQRSIQHLQLLAFTESERSLVLFSFPENKERVSPKQVKNYTGFGIRKEFFLGNGSVEVRKQTHALISERERV